MKRIEVTAVVAAAAIIATLQARGMEAFAPFVAAPTTPTAATPNVVARLAP